MSAQQSNQVNEKQHDANAQAASAYADRKLVYADSLLDQVDTAYHQIQAIQTDIALLHTMENALDMIAENMAKVRRLAQEAQQGETTQSDQSTAVHEIRNLMMVNMLIAEDTEINGHLLFKDDIISMCSFAVGELTLRTTHIPEICGIETGDFQAILDSLDSAARTINRQFHRISTVMRILVDTYEQTQSEVDLLLKAQKRVLN